MQEIRFHGRGGQGAVTAAELLAVAAFNDGKYCQAFGAFGPERRGAPVTSFTRIDDKFIRMRQQIYEPDTIVVLDPSLLSSVNVFDGLKKNGIAVINSEKEIASEGHTIFYVNADQIAREIISKPIVNTSMLGALVKATDVVTIDSLVKAVNSRFSGELAKKNAEAVKKTYEECKQCKLK